MGVDFEFMTDSNGRPQIYFIDKGKKTVDVGNKLSDFTIQRELGKGHFGSVCLVVSNKTKKLYAMKQIKSSMYKSQNYLEVEREVKLLENLSHPHVITYFSSFKENNDFYIVTEYINNGSLLDLMKKNIQQKKHIEEKTIWILLIQSLGGLLYLHQNKKIVHRDIKPDNLLLDMNGNLKISDFGLSAIISEEADENVKCHNTVTGAIQFMAPEVAMGKKYDFKSDLYMLGLTFFLLTTNRLPEKKLDMGICIIPIKYEDAKMPDYYSENLKKIINKLLIINPEERPSTRKAYFEAITYYSIKYLKVTSFIAPLQCLYSIPSFFIYFKNGKVKTIIENNENTDDKKYIVTKAFQNAFNICDPLNFNYKLAESECIKLRIMIYATKERTIQNSEISLSDVVPDLLNKIHLELNKYVKNASKNGINNINNEDNDNNDNNNNDVEQTIDSSNEQQVISHAIKNYTEHFRSKISDLFFYLTKTVHECPECQNILKYTTDVVVLSGLYPERAGIYLNKTDLNIIDLFKHYRKKRLFLDFNENCQNCGTIIKDINLTKIFYTSPQNLILSISNYNENKYKLAIDEIIDLKDFVERSDISNIVYKLIGAIFIDKKEDENIYVSIARNIQLNDGSWLYFNGNSIIKCSFNELINHKNLKMLFYTNEKLQI